MGKPNDRTGMIEPCFNELSVEPLCVTAEDVSKRVLVFAHLLAHLHKYGIRKVRYENGIEDILLSTDYTLRDYCVKFLKSHDPKDAQDRKNVETLLSMIRKPYLNDTEEPAFNNYDDVKYEDGEDEKDCMGLYVAHLLGSFSVGFDSGISSPCRLKLTKKNTDGTVWTEYANIAFVSNKEQCIIDKAFIEIMSNQPMTVDAVDKSTSKKTFSLPVHHGLKECKEHGTLLLEDAYVKDILVSIPFDSSEKKYIHDVLPDGSIEIRLYWTKKGYGLRISTSAKDIVEGWWIAKHLEQKIRK